jgi:16S rRNA (uracil1498-N3)-methyltransferase
MSTKLQRLFVTSKLDARAEIALDKDQAHYLGNVLRLKPGDNLLLFNGRDGEWCADLSAIGKKGAQARVTHQTRPQEAGPDLHYLFAPLKRARLDYMAQKATELGASVLRPVITRHTVAERVKTDRLLANAIEAAEQCGILRVPEVREPEKLSKLIDGWDENRLLIFADEAAPHASPLEMLKSRDPGPLAVLIGPEGGFEREERAALLAKAFVLPISLGPRVMRADTAAVAALALVNAALGDWR